MIAKSVKAIQSRESKRKLPLGYIKNILKLSRNNDTQIFFTIENLEILKLLSEIVNNEEFNDIKETVNIINIVNTEKWWL